MKPVCWLARGTLFALSLLTFSAAFAGTPGVFRGTVVPAPAEESNTGSVGWLYVEGRNHLIRRVALADAVIVYGDEIPEKQRQGQPELIEGTEVRVTAEQDSQGEWHALRIEIVGLSVTARATRKTAENLKIPEAARRFRASNKRVE